jgi:hypothetical protein
MTTDHKEVFSEAYYNAIEDGKSVGDAEKAGDQAIQDWSERLMDQADMLRKEIREDE